MYGVENVKQEIFSFRMNENHFKQQEACKCGWRSGPMRLRRQRMIGGVGSIIPLASWLSCWRGLLELADGKQQSVVFARLQVVVNSFSVGYRLS